MALFTARRLRAAAVAGVLGSLLLGAAPAHAAAAPTLGASGLSASVSGTTVTASTTIRTSAGSALVAKVGVCVRDSVKGNFDFVKAQNVTVTTAGFTQTATQTLPVGSYNYWTCAYYNGAWLTLDNAKPFVVSNIPVSPGDHTKFPVGNLQGWKQVFADDFTTDAAAGTFGDVYKNKFSTYHGFADSYNGGTYNRNILSADNGVLDMFLHKENGRPQVAAPAPIVGSPWKGQTYGKFSVRFKSEALSGYKTAWLLWPDSNNWSEGEIDFPEGGLKGTMWAFNHCVGNPSKNCSWVDTQTTYTDWHTLSLEWTPTRVTYLLDGQIVGNDTKNIPSTPMHWVLQTETTSQNAVTQDGHLQIDWVAVYTYDPSATPSATVTSGSTAPVSSTTASGAQIEVASAWKRLA